MERNYDFAGWATRANRLCSDGRTIMKDAFKDCDGKKVPLVWNHNHDVPQTVLGHAILESRDGDMYAYGYFNETESGKDAKLLLNHGDIGSLSIYANQLKEKNKNVYHGIIREVSLVLAGANPSACIDSVIVHDDGSVDEDFEQGVIYSGEELDLIHSEEESEVTEVVQENSTTSEPECEIDSVSEEGVVEHSGDEKEITETGSSEEEKKKIKEVFDTLTEEQKTAVYAVVGVVMNGNDEDDNKEENKVSHNIFDQDQQSPDTYLSHADGVEIIKMAKSNGGNSLKAAMKAFAENSNKNVSLSHADGDDDLGFANIDQLFPEYKNVDGPEPEMLTTDQGWINKVLAKVSKSPMSRLRVRKTDARDITGRRAQGYTKGTQKQFMGNLKLIGRTVDPTTVYNLDHLNRDDIIDITDFDIVQYMYRSQRMNLNEELARQIMIGDGRVGDPTEDDGQEIDKTKIIPIWGDDELFAIHKVIDVESMRTTMNGSDSNKHFGDNYVYSEAVIQSLLYAREEYKGSGSCDFYCTPRLKNVMLLARDLNGRRIYDDVNDLKAAMDVNELITCEQFADKTRTVTVGQTTQTRKLLGILVNLKDYKVGSTKGGEITHFTDFDIRFNQNLSLLETRCSGMLTRPFSAIILEEVVENP